MATLRTSFHQRLAQPLSVLILVLLAVPFALGTSERPEESLPRAMLRALALCGVFWVGWGVTLIGSHNGTVPPVAPLWIVSALFIGLGSWRFAKVPE